VKNAAYAGLTHGCLGAFRGRQARQLNLLLGQLDPSARDLKQISAILLVDMFRHVETLGRTIKVEIAFRLHVPPFWYLWPNPKDRIPACSTPDFPVQRLKEEWPSRCGGKAKPVNEVVDPSFEHEILGGIA
jgi:hypothetical protein